MRRFLGFSLVAGAVVALTALPTFALMIAMKSPTQRALSADVVVVGKVTAIEKDTVEATPNPGAPQKVQYKVAVVKVETPLLGADNLTHLKVGFVPPPKALPPQPVQLPGGGVARPLPGRRPGLNQAELKEGQEYVFFLARHPDAGFYVMPMMSPPLPGGTDEAKKEIEAIKKMAAVLSAPTKSLKAEKPEDRYFAAVTLVTKYRSFPDFAPRGEPAQEPIPADESQLILKSLGEGDWTKFDRTAPNGMQAFYSLGLTDKDGWVAPKPQPGRPGQPGANFNQLTKDAFVKWLAGPGKDYRIKRVVPRKAEDK